MDSVIYISISKQTLDFNDPFGGNHHYPISSAANGIGFAEGSYCTPVGNFEIAEKHGAGAEPFTLFKGRIPIGIYDPSSPSKDDYVLTRILWLSGLDEANTNTKERYIYIHGTNQEEKIGKPASWGCIRMLNVDIIDLYERVEIGDRVVIEP